MNAASREIYLDNNATTAAAPECIEAAARCLRLGPLNPSSKHGAGERAREAVMQARAQVARAFGAAPAEVVFTSGGTESNHLAILGALSLHPQRRQVITSEVEHPSTLMLMRQLESRGIKVVYLPVDAEGRLVMEALEDTLGPQTALVSLMWANNETGVVFPVERAAELAHAHGALFHTDAVQAAGKLPIDLSQLPMDLLSVSGHKLHAPAGTGALFARKGLRLPPQLHGHQERGRRGGTENVSGIVAFGVACAMACADLTTEAARLRELRDRLEQGILALDVQARVNGAAAARLPNTSSIRFAGFEAEWLLDRLDRLGIRASAGAACAAGETRPSHVLTAMGLTPQEALASVRFSLGRYNTAEDVEGLLRALPDVLRACMLKSA